MFVSPILTATYEIVASLLNRIAMCTRNDCCSSNEQITPGDSRRECRPTWPLGWGWLVAGRRRKSGRQRGTGSSEPAPDQSDDDEPEDEAADDRQPFAAAILRLEVSNFVVEENLTAAITAEEVSAIARILQEVRLPDDDIVLLDLAVWAGEGLHNGGG